MHGANRLASNSLLEAVVFGLRAGRAMAGHAHDRPPGNAERPPMLIPRMTEAEVRGLTWDHCGIARDRDGLLFAAAQLGRSELCTPRELTLAAIELRNIHQIAGLIADCALWREESRGAHYRTDFPEKREEFRLPSRIARAHAAVRR